MARQEIPLRPCCCASFRRIFVTTLSRCCRLWHRRRSTIWCKAVNRKGVGLAASRVQDVLIRALFLHPWPTKSVDSSNLSLAWFSASRHVFWVFKCFIMSVTNGILWINEVRERESDRETKPLAALSRRGRSAGCTYLLPVPAGDPSPIYINRKLIAYFEYFSQSVIVSMRENAAHSHIICDVQDDPQWQQTPSKPEDTLNYKCSQCCIFSIKR